MRGRHSRVLARFAFRPARMSNVRATVEPRRLLFVLNDLPFFVSHRLMLAEAAARAGWDVHVAAPMNSEAAGRVRTAGIEIHPIPMNRASMNPLIELRSIGALVRLYRRVKPDIVHHVTAKPVIYGSIAARVTGVPAMVNAIAGLGYIFMASGMVARIRLRALTYICRIAFAHPRLRLVVQNPDDRAQFIAMRCVAESQTTLIRGSGVDLNQFPAEPETIGTPIVMLPARMLRDKGVREFVQASQLLRQKNVRARFVLAGPIDANPTAIQRDEINAWVKLGHVEYWGNVQDAPALLAQSTIVCLPSYREGVPKVLLEAMSTCRAIVTTDVPGCRDAVLHGDNGLLVPPRDHVALARAIQHLLDHPTERLAMATRGRQRAEREFRVDQVIEATLRIYEELLA